MVELPSDTRAQLRAQQDRLSIPAMYDALTWFERRTVREDYIILQKGLCWHCKEDIHAPPPKHITDLPLDQRYWPAEFLKHPIHLHHDHKTGLTIGSTHAYCNAVLAQYFGE